MLSWKTVTATMTRKDHQMTRVLVVEDETLVSEMICWSLEELGYQVIARITTGEKAIQVTTRLKPDVVILDIRLPDMNGIEVIRGIHEACPTPIVVLTAYDALETIKQAVKAGAGAYLIKPASSPEMERAITIAKAVFNRFHELQERINTLQSETNDANALAEV